MAANTTPIFALTPVIGRARLTAANTASDGSGTTATLVTAGTDGTRIDMITITNSQATAAASSAMVIKVFISDTGGTNLRMLAEVALPAATRSTTAIGTTATITFVGGLVIPSGTIITVCQSVYAGAQDQNDIIARGADF